MRNIAVSVLMAIGIVASAAAQQGVLDLPIHDQWIKMQNTDDLVQWSIVPAAHPDTRVDYITYRDGNDSWKSYYLIRSQCPNGTFAMSTLEPQHKSGLGKNCDGSIVQTTSTVVDELPKLPAKALFLP